MLERCSVVYGVLGFTMRELRGPVQTLRSKCLGHRGLPVGIEARISSDRIQVSRLWALRDVQAHRLGLSVIEPR
jgi:hypothetical protein